MKGNRMRIGITMTALKGIMAFCICGLLVAPTLAATYDEGVSGDLSNNSLAPTTLTLTLGSNSIIGNVNGTIGDSQDWIALTVPAGDQMTTYVDSVYTSTDSQGFTGFQAGSSFTGSAFSASSYAGFAHFGTNATGNGSGASANTLNINLLPAPYMADPSVVTQGATGFTPPLSVGTYTFLIQQLGASTNYEFDISVVPEPASLSLLGLGTVGLLAVVTRRRKAANCVV